MTTLEPGRNVQPIAPPDEAGDMRRSDPLPPLPPPTTANPFSVTVPLNSSAQTRNALLEVAETPVSVSQRSLGTVKTTTLPPGGTGIGGTWVEKTLRMSLFGGPQDSFVTPTWLIEMKQMPAKTTPRTSDRGCNEITRFMGSLLGRSARGGYRAVADLA